MDLIAFRDLLTPTGQDAIHKALDLQPVEKDFLTHFQQLCKDYPREVARSALEIAILRGEAVSKFPQADKMFFTREALEQASSFEVASHRIERYMGYDQILDLGCSIGGDTIALCTAAPTVGIDINPLRLEMAKANIQALELPADFIHCDLVRAFPCFRPTSSMAIFFDPARRVDGRRSFSVKGYHPPLSVIEKWLPNFSAIGVKISPGVKIDDVAEYDSEIEFISLRGELKEAVLWFGALKESHRRATVLPGPYTMMDDGKMQIIEEKISEPLQYFYEPDPSVIRAGMVRNLMDDIRGAQVDPEIAYLTAMEKTATPFARVWRVEAWFPFQLKRLRAFLRERQVGRVTVKKRGSPIVPEELIQALRLSKDSLEKRVIFLTQLQSRPIVVVCYPNSPEA